MNELASARVNSRLWIAAFLIATFGSGLLFKQGVLRGWPGMALFGATFLLLIPMVRSIERARAASGNSSAAITAYNRRMIIASLAYVVLLLGCATVAHEAAPVAAVRVLLALIVAAPVLLMVRAMALLIRDERDEYLRLQVVEQILIATGVVLTVSTIYGFLNVFDLAPRVDAYLIVPLWGVGLGLGRLLKRDGVC
jgi:hypothetical protein